MSSRRKQQTFSILIVGVLTQLKHILEMVSDKQMIAPLINQ